MSQYTYLIKTTVCSKLDEINKAILEQDPNWDDLTSAEQIISIQWIPQEKLYLVIWRVREWLNTCETS